ncbi:two-component regulator propeller domain-containing protein [Portibacter marinus]|uniref:two-component regulator propeller domain-containing protein n=1 Tax=Portibacter marinus TaxID=2898660 RepID=UPI001F1EBF13|nr:two-component regulator propeller domain-containing protein [Portibacter marinus]
MMNFSIAMCFLFFILYSTPFLNLSCSSPSSKAVGPQEIMEDSSLRLKQTRGVRDILEDQEGNVWVSTPDYVARSNGDSIYYFSERDGLTIVGNLHQDIEGTIWVENGLRVFRFDGERFKESFLDSTLVANQLWFQRGLNPNSTFYEKPGVYHSNLSGTIFLNFPISQDESNKNLYYPTTKVHYGKDKSIWLGTMEKVFNLKDGTFTSIGRAEMGRLDDARNIGIRDIFVDIDGDLWMADNGAGIFIYDGVKVQNFTRKHNLDVGQGTSSRLDRAFSIEQDTSGLMWFGTAYSGIWSYNQVTEEFTIYGEDQGVTSEIIWTIFKTKDGHLLFAGESPGAVFRFDGNSFYQIL